MAEKRGRPAIKYNKETAKQVQAMAQYGVPQDKIALLVGIAPMTLVRLYRNEIDRGSTTANLNIVKTLYQKAMGGDTASLIFWCKARLGWSDRGPNKGNEDAPGQENAGRDWKQAFKEAFNSVG